MQGMDSINKAELTGTVQKGSTLGYIRPLLTPSKIRSSPINRSKVWIWIHECGVGANWEASLALVVILIYPDGGSRFHFR